MVLLMLVASRVVTAQAVQAARDVESAAYLEQMVSSHPGDALIHYKLGLAYRSVGDDRRAALNLQTAMSQGFDNLAVRMNLIEAAFVSKQTALALETCKTTLSPALKSAGPLLRIGGLLFDHLFYNEALKAFQAAVGAAPNAFEPRFRLALTYYLLGDYAATLETLKNLPNGEDGSEAICLMAAAEAKIGHIEAASAGFRRALELHSASPHAYINLALLDLDRGDTAGAAKLLDGLRSLPGMNNAKVFYTAVHNSCGEVTQALEKSEQPASPAPENADFYYQLASQLQERFNYLSAVQLIRLAQKREGNSVRVLYTAGLSCLNHDPLSTEPIRLLQAAIDRDPKFYRAYYLLGRAFTREGKLEEALAAYRVAADLHPQATYFVNLGKALLRNANGTEQDRQTARVLFEKALTLDGSDAQAHLELGRLLVQVDQPKARLHLEKALELEPDFYEADYLLGRLLYRLGDEEKSRKYLAAFAEKKSALTKQSVIGAGFVGEGN